MKPEDKENERHREQQSGERHDVRGGPGDPMLEVALPEHEVLDETERRGKGAEGKQHAQIDPNTHPHTVAMATKLQTDQGRAAYRRRKWIAEPPNGWIKSVLGFRQFSLRGLHRVQAEFKLVCLALNLRRMGAMQVA